MLFSSSVFIFIFLPVVFVFAFMLKNYSGTLRNVFLVLASLFFYGYWNPAYLPLIVISILVNYSISKMLGSGPRAKLWLFLGVTANLLVLVVFKYLDFLIVNVNALGWAGDPIGLVLPLAISFFTFQQIAYLVDSYRGQVGKTNLLDYALFVTFFPQLIAGPIVHHKEMMPQFKSSRIRLAAIAEGGALFSIGLFKKIVIADYFGEYADMGYANVNNLDFWGAWSTSLSYTVQLYYDFSGYCDMAMGAALFFGIRLPINFNSPYRACNIQDFWRRWHMTLSRWLRDYVYIPLGGNRIGEVFTYRNLLITFVLGGIWHGAGWGFLMWGIMHGVGVALHRFWQELGLRLYRPIGWVLTILFVHFSWVFFRAKDLATAKSMMERMVFYEPSLLDSFSFYRSMYLTGTDQINGGYIVVLAALAMGATLVFKNSVNLAAMVNDRPVALAVLSGTAFMIGVILMVGASSETFLYFNF